MQRKHHQLVMRYCYESALDGWPGLGGRIAVKFVIQPEGRVHPAALATTTLEHRPTECCIVNAVETWRFPSPQGCGVAVVTYPFVLESSRTDTKAGR